MTIKFIEESCIFIILFGLIFQKKKNTNNYYKNIVMLRQENRTVVA